VSAVLYCLHCGSRFTTVESAVPIPTAMEALLDAEVVSAKSVTCLDWGWTWRVVNTDDGETYMTRLL
jgi:hypothetical protein